MSLPVGTILRLVCTLVHADTGVLQNIFNAVITGSGGPFDEDDITTDLGTWLDDMYTWIEPYISDEFAPAEGGAYEYDSIDDDWDEIGQALPTFTPGATASVLPRGTCCLVNARTSDPDVNGKKYLGVFTSGHFINGVWASTMLAQVANFADEWATPFVGAVSGATITPGIWSPTRTNLYVLSGTMILDAIAAYQRRRKPGVGI